MARKEQDLVAAKKKEPSPRAAVKAERMRSAILAAAEEQFARGGYAATRIDAVAEAMGMTGAALFYYFRDKGALYDAMMENAFAPLAASLGEVLSAPTSIAERIERAVEVWIGQHRHSACARSADPAAHRGQRTAPRIGSSSIRRPTCLLRLAFTLFEQGRKTGELKPIHDHPYHAASAIIGSTIFYASALAPLVPSHDFDPLSAKQVDAHKRDAVRIVRRYLGMKAKPRVRAPKLGK